MHRRQSSLLDVKKQDQEASKIAYIALATFYSGFTFLMGALAFGKAKDYCSAPSIFPCIVSSLVTIVGLGTSFLTATVVVLETKRYADVKSQSTETKAPS